MLNLLYGAVSAVHTSVHRLPVIDLTDLCLFVKVAEHGGFAGASREIDAPNSS